MASLRHLLHVSQEACVIFGMLLRHALTCAPQSYEDTFLRSALNGAPVCVGALLQLPFAQESPAKRQRLSGLTLLTLSLHLG